jgi:hypothetical protein
MAYGMRFDALGDSYTFLYLLACFNGRKGIFHDMGVPLMLEHCFALLIYSTSTQLCIASLVGMNSESGVDARSVQYSSSRVQDNLWFYGTMAPCGLRMLAWPAGTPHNHRRMAWSRHVRFRDTIEWLHGESSIGSSSSCSSLREQIEPLLRPAVKDGGDAFSFPHARQELRDFSVA